MNFTIPDSQLLSVEMRAESARLPQTVVPQPPLPPQAVVVVSMGVAAAPPHAQTCEVMPTVGGGQVKTTAKSNMLTS